jgi:hypothetical protein
MLQMHPHPGGLRHQLNLDQTNPTLKPMPLTLQAGESDVGRPSMSDVLVVEGFSRELGAAGSFGDARVGAVPSGRVGSLENLGDSVMQASGESVRGKNPPAR